MLADELDEQISMNHEIQIQKSETLKSQKEFEDNLGLKN